MTLLYIIIGVILTVGFFFYLRDFVPLRPKEPGFEYVYVNEDGTVSELNDEDVGYLKTVSSPTDSEKTYIKSRYQ